jgi:hypothetical protein
MAFHAKDIGPFPKSLGDVLGRVERAFPRLLKYIKRFSQTGVIRSNKAAIALYLVAS